MLKKSFKNSFGTAFENVFLTACFCGSQQPKSEKVGEILMPKMMKKITFIVAFSLLFANTTFAKITFRNFDPNQPIEFVERGITFYVFANGQFDFNTQPSRGEVIFKNGRRGVNATFGSPNRFTEGGVRVEHDNFGRIRRIGNVFVNYDQFDRIKRIGSVYMSYNRFALDRVGGLQLIYNRFGIVVDVFGSVKRDYFGHNYSYYGNSNGTCNAQSQEYNDQNVSDSEYNYNSNQENEDYYYYRKDGKKSKIESNKKPKKDKEKED